MTFPSEEDATKAVSQLDKSEISGRQINVELAKPMPATSNGAASAAARAPKRAAKKAAETAATEETAKEGLAAQEDNAQPKKNKARKAVSFSSLSALSDSNVLTSLVLFLPAQAPWTSRAPRRRRDGRGGRRARTFVVERGFRRGGSTRQRQPRE